MGVRRGFVALLLLYVIMDFADPSIPGAVAVNRVPEPQPSRHVISARGDLMRRVLRSHSKDKHALPSGQSSPDDH